VFTPIPAVFGYADQIFNGMMFLAAFCAGWIAGGAFRG